MSDPATYDVSEEIHPIDNDNWPLVIFSLAIVWLVLLALPLLLVIEEIRETFHKRNGKVTPTAKSGRALNEEEAAEENEEVDLEEEESKDFTSGVPGKETKLGRKINRVTMASDQTQTIDEGTGSLEDIVVRVSDKSFGPDCLIDYNKKPKDAPQEKITLVDEGMETDSFATLGGSAAPNKLTLVDKQMGTNSIITVYPKQEVIPQIKGLGDTHKDLGIDADTDTDYLSQYDVILVENKAVSTHSEPLLLSTSPDTVKELSGSPIDTKKPIAEDKPSEKGNLVDIGVLTDSVLIIEKTKTEIKPEPTTIVQPRKRNSSLVENKQKERDSIILENSKLEPELIVNAKELDDHPLDKDEEVNPYTKTEQDSEYDIILVEDKAVSNQSDFFVASTATSKPTLGSPAAGVTASILGVSRPLRNDWPDSGPPDPVSSDKVIGIDPAMETDDIKPDKSILVDDKPQIEAVKPVLEVKPRIQAEPIIAEDQPLADKGIVGDKALIKDKLLVGDANDIDDKFKIDAKSRFEVEPLMKPMPFMDKSISKVLIQDNPQAVDKPVVQDKNDLDPLDSLRSWYSRHSGDFPVIASSSPTANKKSLPKDEGVLVDKGIGSDTTINENKDRAETIVQPRDNKVEKRTEPSLLGDNTPESIPYRQELEDSPFGKEIEFDGDIPVEKEITEDDEIPSYGNDSEPGTLESDYTDEDDDAEFYDDTKEKVIANTSEPVLEYPWQRSGGAIPYPLGVKIPLLQQWPSGTDISRTTDISKRKVSFKAKENKTGSTKPEIIWDDNETGIDPATSETNIPKSISQTKQFEDDDDKDRRLDDLVNNPNLPKAASLLSDPPLKLDFSAIHSVEIHGTTDTSYKSPSPQELGAETENDDIPVEPKAATVFSNPLLRLGFSPTHSADFPETNENKYKNSLPKGRTSDNGIHYNDTVRRNSPGFEDNETEQIVLPFVNERKRTNSDSEIGNKILESIAYTLERDVQARKDEGLNFDPEMIDEDIIELELIPYDEKTASKQSKQLKLGFSPIHTMELSGGSQTRCGSPRNKSILIDDRLEIKRPILHQMNTSNKRTLNFNKDQDQKRRAVWLAVAKRNSHVHSDSDSDSEHANESSLGRTCSNNSASRIINSYNRCPPHDCYGMHYEYAERGISHSQERPEKQQRNLKSSKSWDEDIAIGRRGCLPFPPINALSNEQYGLLSYANFAQAEVAYHPRPSDDDFPTEEVQGQQGSSSKLCRSKNKK